MNELGYKDSVTTMNGLVRKIIPDSELYMELYSAIFFNNDSAITEKPTEELIATVPDSTDVDSTVSNPIVPKENIAPIWEDINKNFRETTFFKKNYDKEFNADFNRESGKSKDFFNQKGNFWIKLHHKIYG